MCIFIFFSVFNLILTLFLPTLYFNILIQPVHIHLWLFIDLTDFIAWNIKGYDIELLLYWDWKITVCGKNSVPVMFFFYFLEASQELEMFIMFQIYILYNLLYFSMQNQKMWAKRFKPSFQFCFLKSINWLPGLRCTHTKTSKIR